MNDKISKESNNVKDSKEKENNSGCLIIGVIFILAILGFLTDDEDNDSKRLRAKVFLFFKSSEVVDIRYDNGQIKEKYRVKKTSEGNYVKHGLYSIYYKNGIKSSEVNYRIGLKHGKCYGWHENGNRMHITPFKNDLVHGIQKFFYEDGKLKEILFFQNDNREGVYKTFYPDGSLWEIGECKNGFFHGFHIRRYNIKNKNYLKISKYEKGSSLSDDSIKGINSNQILLKLEKKFKQQKE